MLAYNVLKRLLGDYECKDEFSLSMMTEACVSLSKAFSPVAVLRLHGERRRNGRQRPRMLSRRTACTVIRWPVSARVRGKPRKLATSEPAYKLYGRSNGMKMKRLRFSACLVLTLSEDRDAARAWLRGIEARITYGEHTTPHRAMSVAFTATGLSKLGLAEADLATFSLAFQHGMTAPWRSRILGDRGKHGHA